MEQTSGIWESQLAIKVASLKSILQLMARQMEIINPLSQLLLRCMVNKSSTIFPLQAKARK